MRVAPDDDVYRVNAVWLGPRGLTFPWTARYLAYATWLVTFLVILLAEAIVPPLHVSVPPVWEFSITTLFTYAVMSFVDHERPVRAVWQTFVADLGAPRTAGKGRPLRVLARVRVHARPRHDRRLTRAYFAGTEHTVPTHAARYAPTGSPTGPDAPAPRRPRGARGPRLRRPGRLVGSSSTSVPTAIPATAQPSPAGTGSAAAATDLHRRPGSRPWPARQDTERQGRR